MPRLTLDPELDRLLPLEGEMIALGDLVDNLASFDALIAVNTELQALVTNLYSIVARIVAVVNDLYDATSGALFDESNDAYFPHHIATPNDIYALGGLHVGGIDAPGSDDAIIDGQLDVGDFITALGGLHVGGASDPGTDNLVVDGNTSLDGNDISYKSGAYQEFFRQSNNPLDTTIAIAITFTSQNNRWVGHLVEIDAALADTAGTARYVATVRYAVTSLTSLYVTDMTHDLCGVSEAVATAGTTLTVTLTIGTTIDNYALHIKVLNANYSTGAIVTGVSTS